LGVSFGRKKKSDGANGTGAPPTPIMEVDLSSSESREGDPKSPASDLLKRF
jgi:hypothetical protein